MGVGEKRTHLLQAGVLYVICGHKPGGALGSRADVCIHWRNGASGWPGLTRVEAFIALWEYGAVSSLQFQWNLRNAKLHVDQEVYSIALSLYNERIGLLFLWNVTKEWIGRLYLYGKTY